MEVQKLYDIDLFLGDAKADPMLRRRINEAIASVTAALRKSDQAGATVAFDELPLFADELPEQHREKFLGFVAAARIA